MDNVKRIGTLVAILAVIVSAGLVTGCETDADTSYEVGDTGPAGGLIFYDDESGYDFDGNGTIESTEKDLLDGSNDGTLSGDRYLEAAPYGWYDGNADPLNPWGGQGTSVTSTGEAIGMGEANTDRIVSTFGSGVYAAKACYDHSVVVNETTYDDWFLPSLDALSVMYSELHANSLGGFTAYHYWSSSELSSNDAKSWSFLNNNFSLYEKNNNFRIRPVRSF